MSTPLTPGPESEQQKSSTLLDVLIRAGLVFALAALCYKIFRAVPDADGLGPDTRRRNVPAAPDAGAPDRRQAGPGGHLDRTRGSDADRGTHRGADDFTRGHGAWTTCRPSRTTPLRSRRHARAWQSGRSSARRCMPYWSQAHADLPAFVQKMQPKIGNIAKGCARLRRRRRRRTAHVPRSRSWWPVSSWRLALRARAASEAIFSRIMSPQRAPEFVKLSTATVRAVAQGVIGVAIDPGHRRRLDADGRQSAVRRRPSPCDRARAGHRPDSGAAGHGPGHYLHLDERPVRYRSRCHLTRWCWASQEWPDNFLKPLMLGRGVDAPMPVILLGALGGMAAAGILGLFVGAVLLALGYQIFMGWVHRGQGATEAQPVG